MLLTAPATATGRLLSGLVDSAQEFARLPYASVAVITLVVRGVRSEASGLLVPPGELPTIKALTLLVDQVALGCLPSAARPGARGSRSSG